MKLPSHMKLNLRTFKLRKWNVSLVKKHFDTKWSFQATWNWITEHSNYENEMYLLWTNFYIFNKVSKPHDSGSQNIQAMEMKCTSCEKTFRYSKKLPSHMILIHRTFNLGKWNVCISCEKTFRYVLNEASKPHETESFYFLDRKKSNSLF